MTTTQAIYSKQILAMFELGQFTAWLNIVDARMGYEERRLADDVEGWRALFNAGLSVNEAILCYSYSGA